MEKEIVKSKFDYIIFTIVIFLVTFGLIVLYSASDINILFKQMIFCACGICITIFLSFIPYEVYERLIKPIFIICLLLVFATTFAGKTQRGSSRWLEFNGLNFQPSEFMKLAMILYLSKELCYNQDKLIKKDISLKILMIAYIPTLIVALNNLSTGVIMFLLSTLIIFLISKKKLVYFLVLSAFALFYVFAYYIAQVLFNMGILKKYQVGRIFAWKDPEAYADVAYQTLQSIYAIGSGGIFGKGYMNSIQKKLIPEVHNDMIFSVVCEELGAIGAFLLIILYVILIFRIFSIITKLNNLNYVLVTFGVGLHISLQVILNIAVATNLIPNTGVTLPFVSYGGSSLIVIFIEIGIVLSIYRYNRNE